MNPIQYFKTAPTTR